MRKIFLPLLFIALGLNAQEVNTSFMVFSDPHYYDPSLGVEGEAFQEYLDGDRKLLKESRELLQEAMAMINASDVEFVIVPGDLTKDGTLVSHQMFAGFMAELENKGRQVYVVPGNHDVSNGESHGYEGDRTILVDNVGPEKFREIFHDFGFAEALYSDEHSLSYVVEPVEGLWLFGLDDCLYRENEADHHPVTDGEFLDETLDWIDEMAAMGRGQNKKMIAMMHHGIIEHYEKQNRFFGEYVVNDYKKVSKRFAEAGINVVFTGHYHSQDITKKEWKDGSFIVDIETGSLVTYPCPLREVQLQGDIMTVNSLFIEEIPMYPDNFVEYSKAYVHAGIAGIAEEVMVDMWLRREDAQKLSGQIGDAFISHYTGDEPTVDRYLDVSGVGLLGRLMILTKRRLIKELHTDLPPADNQLKFNIATGEIL